VEEEGGKEDWVDRKRVVRGGGKNRGEETEVGESVGGSGNRREEGMGGGAMLKEVGVERKVEEKDRWPG